MHRPALTAMATGLAFMLTFACSKSSSDSGGGSGAKLTLHAEVLSGAVPGGPVLGVKADGASTVVIEVSGGKTAPIRLKTTQGTFAGGTARGEIAATSGTIELTVCDARTTSGCGGSVTVTAVDGAGVVGGVDLRFVGVETACNNGRDDNGDGRADCADSDCDQRACTVSGTAGVCQGAVCVPAACIPASATEICDNGVDDDCGGGVDCAQTSCQGQPCKAGSSAFVCLSGACTDATSGFGLSLKSARTRLPADGQAQTTVTATVTKDGKAASGVQVNFTTSLGTFGGGGTTAAATTGSDGTATVTFRASAADGAASVQASVASAAQLSQSVTITMPALGSIALGKLLNPVMGVRYSGWNEQNQISVVLLDAQQQPYPDGLAVRFEHRQLGGSTLSTPWTADVAGSCLQSDGCLGYQGQVTSPAGSPDSTGTASVSLQSGTLSGLVAVQATATAGGVTRSMAIQNVAIVGAKASGSRMSIDCTPKNVPALRSNDCINSFYDGRGNPITCTAYFADRFGNVLGKSLLVTFASEAGAAGPPVTTAQYDPGQGTDQTSRLGFAADSISIAGFSLPMDVPVITGEPSLTYADHCGTRTHNPRDGLVTVIATAKGEEGFADLNGNGVRDSSEPFLDQGEPYVDSNDDGIWESGEAFVDLNGNHLYDGPNGVWDASTTIWAETRVLYTGMPEYGAEFSWVNPTSLVVAVGPPAQTSSFTFGFMDGNLNPLSPTLASYAVKTSTNKVSAAFAFQPSNVDTLGMSFVQHYCDQSPGGATTPTCGQTCASVPCYRVAAVSSAGGVSAGKVNVTAVGAGTDVVSVIPTIDGITDQVGLQVGVVVQ